MGAVLIQAARRTDGHDKANKCFCDNMNMPKKRHYLSDAFEQIKANETQILQMIRMKDHVDRMGEKISLGSMENLHGGGNRQTLGKETGESEERGNRYSHSIIHLLTLAFGISDKTRTLQYVCQIDTIHSPNWQLLMDYYRLHKE